jgi:hypothetical protein
MPAAIAPGDLVVVPSRRALGVGRLERVLDADDGARARVWFYDDGSFHVVPLGDVAPCPAGVWDRKEP